MHLHQEFGLRLTPLVPPITHDDWTVQQKYLNESSLLQLSFLPRQKLLTLLNYGVGIEVEAENAHRWDSDIWMQEDDGSLRGDGVEYKTTYGTRIGQLPRALDTLNRRATAHAFEFNERTSVHVHLDMRTNTLEETKNIFLTYLLFENALFRYAGESRKHNVFCVPIRSSSKCFKTESWREYIAHSEKYSALNLAPLTSFGTMEFRHMLGNTNVDHIFMWVMLLAHLKHFGSHISQKELKKQMFELKTTSRFNHFRDSIFGSLSENIIVESKEVDQAVSDTKLFF